MRLDFLLGILLVSAPFPADASVGSKPEGISPCSTALLPQISISSRPLVDGDYVQRLYDDSRSTQGHFQIEQKINPLTGMVPYASAQQLLKFEDLEPDAQKLVREMIDAASLPRTPSRRPLYAGLSREEFQRDVLEKYRPQIEAERQHVFGQSISREVGVLVVTSGAGERKYYFVSDGEEAEISDASFERNLAKAQMDNAMVKIRRVDFYHTHPDTPLLSYGDQVVLEKVLSKWFPGTDEGNFIIAVALLARKDPVSGQILKHTWLTRRKSP